MKLGQAASLPKAGERKRGATGHVAYLLRQANAAVRDVLEEALSVTNLTQPQFVVLTISNAYGPLSGAEVARMALLTPQTVTVITRNLVREGLLGRKPDPNHGKVVRFAVTTKGADILRRAKHHADKVDSELTAGLSHCEEALIRTWLVNLGTRISN